MLDPTLLTPDSTIGNLPMHRAYINSTILGKEVADTFDQQPSLPGVIIIEDTKMLRVISRRKFLERMSQPYSLELYLKRPIKVFMEVIEHQPTQLPETCKIDEAAKVALTRSEDTLYEPIVVVTQGSKLRLLDIPVLLLAQSQMLVLANTIMQEQKKDVELYLNRLQLEKDKVKEYSQLLEGKQLESQLRNQLLETQKAELVHQSQEIAELNQRFIRIGQLLSLETKKAFQATFDGVDAICHNSDNVIEIGKSLVQELETVQVATKLIEKVGKQARHLSVQAAVVANQAGAQFDGFSRITSEIGKMVTQTLEAGQRMEETVNHFQALISDFSGHAKRGSTVAQSLIEKTYEAEVALLELEKIVSYQDQNFTQFAEDRSREALFTSPSSST
jgi:hypothetical protein